MRPATADAANAHGTAVQPSVGSRRASTLPTMTPAAARREEHEKYEQRLLARPRQCPEEGEEGGQRANLDAERGSGRPRADGVRGRGRTPLAQITTFGR